MGVHLLVLHADTPSSGTPDAFLHNGATYQVPATKTFYVTKISWQIETDGALGHIFQSDTEDAETLLKFSLVTPSGIQAQTLPVNFSIAASKYITFKPSSGTAFSHYHITGYEA